MDRKILHVDMDAFYASVEQRDRPHLRGLPVAVGGSPDGRGVISAASYEARAFGVRSAMATRTALRRCPELVLLPTDFARYRAVSQQLHAILSDFTDRVEPLSLDECYLDVTENRAGLPTATQVAKRIRERVRAELQLTCSIGVAPLKFVAKIASDHRKPDGLTVVPPDQVLAFVHPLPIERLWGIGPATATRLHREAIRTIGDLAALSEGAAATVLGRSGVDAWRMANGIDPREVRPDRGRRSRGQERTFPVDVTDREAVERELARQVRELCAELTGANERARTVTVKVRYDDFDTITRSRTLELPTRDPAVLVPIAAALLTERTDVGRRAIRLVGIGLTGLDVPEDTGQLDLPFSPS
ncbi:MAG: DNA polymerase IV [Myxococcota bacterium]